MVVKKSSKKIVTANENRLRTNIIFFNVIVLIGFGFLMDTPKEIIMGLHKIITTKDTLITDYIMIGGIGATFVNAGLLMLIFTLILKYYKITINGTSYAALFIVAGFSMFGKNIVNVWPIVLGVFLYSKVQKEKFSKYIYIAIFGTALAPMFTEILFFEGFNLFFRIPLAISLSIMIGFFLPALSTHFLKVHQGYNLYNVGFTAGIIGTVFMAILKSYGFSTKSALIWSTGNNELFAGLLYFMFSVMIMIGIYIDRHKLLSRLKATWKYSGRLVTDLITLEGTSITLINMGLLGIFATSYILLINGDLNGPTMGGILTICGFGAFGKNLKNIPPIFLGVALGAWTSVWEINDPAVQLAALFATSLAPISGQFGILFGILAGFIHSSVVLTVGTLHGGLNLYNNGFSAGIVAAVIVPIIEVFRKDETD